MTAGEAGQVRLERAGNAYGLLASGGMNEPEAQVHGTEKKSRWGQLCGHRF